MPDVRIVSSAASLRETVADWLLLKTGNLDERQALANYFKVALMTDMLSDVDEIRPDPDSDDRRGWWADAEAGPIWHGWKIGTKNWLLTRAKVADAYAWEGDTVYRAENYTREAVQPLVDLKICSAVDVTAERIDRDRIDVRVVVYRGPFVAVDLIFQDLWAAMTTEPQLSPYGWST
jgi:phage gp46-like protein